MKHVSLGIIIHRVTAKRLCFQSFELTDRFIRHSSSGGEVSLSIFSTNHETFFRFARRIVTFFPSTSFGNWEEKSKREKERERQEAHMGKLICTLMYSITYGIDVTREWKRSTELKQDSMSTSSAGRPRFISSHDYAIIRVTLLNLAESDWNQSTNTLSQTLLTQMNE